MSPEPSKKWRDYRIIDLASSDTKTAVETYGAPMEPAGREKQLRLRCPCLLPLRRTIEPHIAMHRD